MYTADLENIKCGHYPPMAPAKGRAKNQFHDNQKKFISLISTLTLTLMDVPPLL